MSIIFTTATLIAVAIYGALEIDFMNFEFEFSLFDFLFFVTFIPVFGYFATKFINSE